MKFATKLAARIKDEIAAATFDYHRHFPDTALPAPQTTFADYSLKWLKVQRLSLSTMASYRMALESFWNPAIGSKELSSIRYSDIVGALAGTALAGKTLNNYLVPMRGVFDMAVRDGILVSSPALGVKNSKVQKPQPDPLELHEVESILAHMAKYGDHVVNYFEFAFFTGMRPSELISLQWGDIDWNRKQIRVERAKVLGEEKGTKTNQVRFIELNSRALAALQRQKLLTFLAGGAVFYNPATNKAWHDPQRQRKLFWTPTLKALGIRHRDSYQTRHTYCTMLLMRGVNPAFVAQQLGHASLKMTLERYFRWIPSMSDKGELDKLEGDIGQKLGSKIA